MTPAKVAPFLERAERWSLTVEYVGKVGRYTELHCWEIRSPNLYDSNAVWLYWSPGPRGGSTRIHHYRGYLGKGRKSTRKVTRQVARFVIDEMGESLKRHHERQAPDADRQGGLMSAHQKSEFTRPGAHSAKNARQVGAPNTRQSGENPMVGTKVSLVASGIVLGAAAYNNGRTTLVGGVV